MCNSIRECLSTGRVRFVGHNQIDNNAREYSEESDGRVHASSNVLNGNV